MNIAYLLCYLKYKYPKFLVLQELPKDLQQKIIYVVEDTSELQTNMYQSKANIIINNSFFDNNYFERIIPSEDYLLPKQNNDSDEFGELNEVCKSINYTCFNKIMESAHETIRQLVNMLYINEETGPKILKSNKKAYFLESDKFTYKIKKNSFEYVDNDKSAEVTFLYYLYKIGIVTKNGTLTNEYAKKILSGFNENVNQLSFEVNSKVYYLLTSLSKAYCEVFQSVSLESLIKLKNCMLENLKHYNFELIKFNESAVSNILGIPLYAIKNGTDSELILTSDDKNKRLDIQYTHIKNKFRCTIEWKVNRIVEEALKQGLKHLQYQNENEILEILCNEENKKFDRIMLLSVNVVKTDKHIHIEMILSNFSEGKCQNYIVGVENMYLSIENVINY